MKYSMFYKSRRLFVSVVAIAAITLLAMNDKVSDAAQYISAIAIAICASNAVQKRGRPDPSDKESI